MPDQRKGEPALAIGQEYDFKIIKLNEADKKIGLSLRGAADARERHRVEEYGRHAAAATVSIDEVMKHHGHGEG